MAPRGAGHRRFFRHIGVAVLAWAMTLAGCGAEEATPASTSTKPVEPTTSEPSTTAPGTPVTTTTAPGTTTTAPGTTTQPSTTTTDPAPPTTAGPMVPWDRVGDGWTLVVTAKSHEAGVWTDRQLWLVSPDGERFLLPEVPGDWLTVEDWSPDRRHALLRETWSLRLIDLETGESTVVVEGEVNGAQFTQPTGRNLVVDTGQLEWRSRTGEVLGVLVEPAGREIYGADGTHLVVGVDDALLHLTADGRPIGELRVPDAAIPGTACHPRKWWPDGRVLAACLVDTGPSAAADALFLIPLDGGPPERLSPDPTLSMTWGYVNAWPYEGGTLVEWASYGDWSGQQLIRPDGTIEDVQWDLPNPSGADHVIDVAPDRIVVHNRGMAGPGPAMPGALVAVTPSTGEVRVLFPGSPEEGGVLRVIIPGNPPEGARAPS